ncbi:tetraacyldisaccharide 4'-kinase, partial [bacterium]|nr:tetraacyldisaccharide 4'-kinase [bacterium]
MLKKIIDNYFFKIIAFPLSILYGLVSTMRNYLYDANIIKPKHLVCKVISVGNITTGGSGKTPAVEFLAHYLKSIGKNVGIISRGYGRVSKDVVVVTDGITKPLTWGKYGDEAFLLSNKLDDIPIIVGRSKYQAGLKMVNNFNIDVIIVDDGFQHRSLYRDLDIVLINSKDTLMTHRLIPLGLLRE